MTRAQKDQVWDIIPTSFIVPSVNNSSSATFLKDGITETDINHVQVLETFQGSLDRYPTVQINYARADTRVNFSNFYMGAEFDDDQYQADLPVNSWENLKDNEKIFDLTPDPDDPIKRIDVLLRPIASSTSYVILELFESKDGGSNYRAITKDYIYPEVMGAPAGTGEFISILTSAPFASISYLYKVRARSLGIVDDPNDTGHEIALSVGGTPVHRLFKPIYYDKYGKIEDLVISIRVTAEDKELGYEPGLTEYCDAQDIVDIIISKIELAFETTFDVTVDDAEMITSSQQMDMTEGLSSGASEITKSKQIDFIIANENSDRVIYVPAKSVSVKFMRDSTSDVL